MKRDSLQSACPADVFGDSVRLLPGNFPKFTLKSFTRLGTFFLWNFAGGFIDNFDSEDGPMVRVRRLVPLRCCKVQVRSRTLRQEERGNRFQLYTPHVRRSEHRSGLFHVCAKPAWRPIA